VNLWCVTLRTRWRIRERWTPRTCTVHDPCPQHPGPPTTPPRHGTSVRTCVRQPASDSPSTWPAHTSHDINREILKGYARLLKQMQLSPFIAFIQFYPILPDLTIFSLEKDGIYPSAVYFCIKIVPIGDWGHLLTLTLTSDDLESRIIVNVSSTLTNTTIWFVAALSLIVDVYTDVRTYIHAYVRTCGRTDGHFYRVY